MGFLVQAAAESQTDGAVCAFSKLSSSVERCQADVLEVNQSSISAEQNLPQGECYVFESVKSSAASTR